MCTRSGCVGSVLMTFTPAAAFDHHFDAVLTRHRGYGTASTRQIVDVAASPRWADPVDRLGCLRGISALTGLALTVEIGDWTRFHRVLDRRLRRLGAHRVLLGRLSGARFDHQSRQRSRPAAVDRSCLASPPALPQSRPTMRARWAKVDPALKDRGHAGNRRLHQQWCRFNERKKPHVVANVAVARQLAGWCWSLATLT